MSEWPDAPRLTSALRKRAEDITPSDRRDEVMKGRSSDPKRRTTAVAVDPVGRRRARSRQRPDGRHRNYLSIAAVALLVVGASVAVRAAMDRDNRPVVMIDTAEPAPSDDGSVVEAADTQAGLRSFMPLDPCVSNEVAEQYALDADDGSRERFATTASAGRSDGGLAFDRFVVLDELDPLDQASNRHRLVPGARHQVDYVDVRGFASITEFERFSGAMHESLCYSTVPTLVATGATAARFGVDISCAADGSPGIQGVVLVDAVPSLPADCRTIRPVYLIGSTPVDDPAVQRWAFFQGCDDPTATVDSAGNTITRWASCDSTLVHVDTAGASAWSLNEVDGESLDRFITTIARLPR